MVGNVNLLHIKSRVKIAAITTVADWTSRKQSFRDILSFVGSL